MSRRKSLLTVLSLLAAGLAAGVAYRLAGGPIERPAGVGREALLDVAEGQIPDDIGSDRVDNVKMTIEDCTDLGGKALKVVFASPDAFGDRQARVQDWRGFESLRLDAFNPGREDIHLTLTIRHKGTKNYQTRVDLPVVLKPGRNSVGLPIDRMANVNGSAPDLSEVGKWYFGLESPKAPTFYLGSVWLAKAIASQEGASESHGTSPATKMATRVRAGKMPPIAKPVMFDTPEADAILSALQVFPPESPWNTDISDWPVHPNSRNIVTAIGVNKPFRYNPDMGFILVPPSQKKVTVKIVGDAKLFDKGPFPVPDNMPIEGWPVAYQMFRGVKNPILGDAQRDKLNEGGDRHAIVVDPVNRMLYEFYQARKTDSGWAAAWASVLDLKSSRPPPAGWMSCDAAGLPIFPAVVRYDELQRGMVQHAMRVTVKNSRRAYVAPATHFASRQTDPNLPRMGERLRLRSDYDISSFSPAVQAILKGLKKYGMFVADNGIDWAISVAPDPRIPSMHAEFRRIKGSAFEVVQPPD
jgi:hypothetical protein